MFRVDPQETKIPQLHAYLLGAVGPRPIAFASTVDKEGNPNLAPFSFFNVFSANPPIAVFSPARSGRTGATKNTYDNIKEVPEVVINIVNYSIVEQASLASTEYTKGINEFVKAGFTPLLSEKIRPARVQESPVQMECVVREVIELGQGGGAGNLIICEVVMMHIAEEVLNAEKTAIDQRKIDLVARMGGNFYCRAHGDALFEIVKPMTVIGIGFDQLPGSIRHSKVLTGNQLGKLAGIEHLPDETEVNEYKLLELSDLFIAHEKEQVQLEHLLHERAAKLLDQGKLEEAWKTLLAFNG